MKFKVYNIKWDTDGEDVDLPNELIIEVPSDEVLEEELDDYLSDEISNVTGFCHFGFEYILEDVGDYVCQNCGGGFNRVTFDVERDADFCDDCL